MRLQRVRHRDRIYYASLVDDATLQPYSAAPWAGGVASDRLIPRRNVETLVPVEPSKIVCVGRNYRAHAEELGHDVPTEPLLFLKPPSALLADGGTICLPTASARVEHEGELGVVIGARLRHADEEQARAAIFGLTCVNDVTARDLQKADVQFTRAKGFDTFCPCGPVIVTDVDPADLGIVVRVGGEVRQSGRTAAMVFPVPALVAFISGVMTLEPGDLVCTGTPSGVGPLTAGQAVEVEIEGVGLLRNAVGSSASAS